MPGGARDLRGLRLEHRRQARALRQARRRGGRNREDRRMSYGSQPSLTLLELWERQSARSNTYFSGYWGNLSVALLRDGERPHPTRPGEVIVVWRLVASERQPRPAAQKP